MITATKKAHINCSTQRVYEIVTNNHEYGWRSDLSKIDVLKGEHSFVEYSKNGIPTLFTIIELVPNKRYSFKMQNNRMTGKWIGTFDEKGEGTDIQFTEMISVKSRFISLLAHRYLKKQQVNYIRDLKRVAEAK